MSQSKQTMLARRIKAALYNVALALTVIVLFVLIGLLLALKATPMP